MDLSQDDITRALGEKDLAILSLQKRVDELEAQLAQNVNTEAPVASDSL